MSVMLSIINGFRFGECTSSVIMEQ